MRQGFQNTTPRSSEWHPKSQKPSKIRQVLLRSTPVRAKIYDLTPVRRGFPNSTPKIFGVTYIDSTLAVMEVRFFKKSTVDDCMLDKKILRFLYWLASYKSLNQNTKHQISNDNITKFQSFGMNKHCGSYSWMTSFMIPVYDSIDVRGSNTWIDPILVFKQYM